MQVRFDEKPIVVICSCNHKGKISATLNGIIYCEDCLEIIDE